MLHFTLTVIFHFHHSSGEGLFHSLNLQFCFYKRGKVWYFDFKLIELFGFQRNTLYLITQQNGLFKALRKKKGSVKSNNRPSWNHREGWCCNRVRWGLFMIISGHNLMIVPRHPGHGLPAVPLSEAGPHDPWPSRPPLPAAGQSGPQCCPGAAPGHEHQTGLRGLDSATGHPLHTQQQVSSLTHNDRDIVVWYNVNVGK